MLGGGCSIFVSNKVDTLIASAPVTQGRYKVKIIITFFSLVFMYPKIAWIYVLGYFALLRTL